MNKRIIYSNYDLWCQFSEQAKMNLARTGNTNPTQEEILAEVYHIDADNWGDIQNNLEHFFSEGVWIAQGTIGRWDGKYAAGFTFNNLSELLTYACKDCSQWKIYEWKGNMFLESAHHDGTNYFKIKKVTDKGINYLKNWENGYKADRTLQYMHTMVMRYYTTTPQYLRVQGILMTKK